MEAQDGTSFAPTVVARDPDRDIAILEFTAGVRPFATLVPLGRAATPEIGEGVVIIGSPLGTKGTVTASIVSQVFAPSS